MTLDENGAGRIYALIGSSALFLLVMIVRWILEVWRRPEAYPTMYVARYERTSPSYSFRRFLISYARSNYFVQLARVAGFILGLPIAGISPGA
jgi:hypothetical protein